MKKRLFLIATVVAMILCFSPVVFATDSQSTAKEDASKHIDSFFSNRENSIPQLNKAAKAPVKDVEEYTLSNGDRIRKEFREVEVFDDLIIKNTRTYIISATLHTVVDTYALFWGGIAGAGGTLVAYYEYTHPRIDSPNSMTTLFSHADGYAKNLIGNYDLTRVTGTWPKNASYTPSANVKFNMRMKGSLGGWTNVTYTNKCTFNRYGVPSFSWY